MAETLFRRFRQHYILAMMIFSRIFGSVGGLLVIYYVELTLKMPDLIRTHFRIAAIIVVVIGCTLTVLLALWETRALRRTLARPDDEPVPLQEAREAVREAFTFVARHHRHEAWLVPCSTLGPVLIFLRLADGASLTILGNITVAVFMGTAMALMSTFFVVEHCMQPVIRSLLKRNLPVDFDSLPRGRLRFRTNLCFTLIIMTTSLMIGTLARQRAADILSGEKQYAIEAVGDLRVHSTYITIAAVIVGVVYSTVLANSVASRADRLVHAMKRVQKGQLAERVHPTGTDEIDALGRQFNAMVRDLEGHNDTIRDLNQNLEAKVWERTQQLEVAMKELKDAQSRLTEVAHRAGMAEIATGVLHNVGNVLNSVNTSTAVMRQQLRHSRTDDLARLAERLAPYRDDLSAFLASDEQGRKFLEYLLMLSDRLSDERLKHKQELDSLIEKVSHIRSIITSQQNHARRISFREELDLCKVINDVLALHSPAIKRHGIEVVKEFTNVPAAHFEKAKMVQIIDNLIKNAIESMNQSHPAKRRLTIEVSLQDPDRAQVAVTDTGHGIAPEHMKNIFRYGFTTKETGNGFGLHSSALAISEMGGTIKVLSDGVAQGATFAIQFPLNNETEREAEPRPAAELPAAIT